MKVLVAVKRVVDYNVKVRVKSDGTGVDIANVKMSMRAKIHTARFYADHILSRVPGIRDSIVDGAASVTGMALEAF